MFGVNAPSKEQLDRLRPDATLVSMLQPALNAALIEDLSRRPVTALPIDAVPGSRGPSPWTC
jgi:H+-translocating NAD(P) transhydrogenase subunit alpha